MNALKLKDKEIHDFVFSSILTKVPAIKIIELCNVQLIVTKNSSHVPVFPQELDSLIFEQSDIEVG